MPEGSTTRPKVLLIGWDAADWKVARPLMDEGKMPNLARLVGRGCTASITTLLPSFSPMLWTSIATGKRPFNHGIHGFTEPRPDGKGTRRVTNLARTTKAIWNILSQNDLRSIVVGWWPSYPAEPIRGAMVSDQFHRITSDFKLVPGMVHPPEAGDALAALRITPEELPADLLEFVVPGARDIDQTKDRRFYGLARIVCECANIQIAGTWLMDHEPCDLCAIYFDAIDHFGHGHMKFHPPRQSWVNEDDFRFYQHAVRAGYQLHDRMLGTLLEKAGPETNVILLSDHGFHPDHLRPSLIPEFHAGPAAEHRNNGMFVMAGPGIRKGAELPGVGLLDIAPTVLTLLGLPIGADMEGRVVSGAFEIPPAVRTIPTWERVEGDDGRHAPHMQLDPMAATESLEQLVALGYVEEPDADEEKAARNTLRDLRTNLAEALQDAGRHAEAAQILRELRAANPNDQRVSSRLFFSALALGHKSEMVRIAEDWQGRRRAEYEAGLARIRELRKLAALTDEQRTELKELRRICRFDPSLAAYLQVRVLCAERRWQAALERLDAIPATDLIRPGLFTERNQILARLGRWKEAEAQLTEGLAIDPHDARIHFGLARLRLHEGAFEHAANSALNGLAVLDRSARGHYLLGIALTRLQLHDDAIRAFGRALTVNPNFPQVHLWLARIHRKVRKDSAQASIHARIHDDLRKNFPVRSATIAHNATTMVPPRPVAFAGTARELPPPVDEVIIVCGLPRSGTSMLMQMLVAGGLEAVTDGLRSADEDNPRGYFEFEPVKQMAAGAPWFDQSRGKVIKIVAPLIPHLPEGVPCRVLLTERNINDILASQRQMMLRRGRKMDETTERIARLKNEYLRLVVWTKGFLAGRRDTSLMCLDRDAVIQNPRRAAEAMNRFLGGKLDVDRMAAEVKPELNRQKTV